MKMYLNGGLSTIEYIKDSTQTIQVLAVGDNAKGVDLTAEGPVLEIYQTINRTNAPVASKTLTGGTAAAGSQEAVLTATEPNFIDLKIGQIYYAYLKTDNAGAIDISENAINFVVR